MRGAANPEHTTTEPVPESSGPQLSSPSATTTGAHACAPREKQPQRGPNTTLATTRAKPAQQRRLSTAKNKKKKTKIINSFYVNLYSILSKMKKLVRRLTLLQNFEYLFNVQLYRKLVDLHICFYIVSWPIGEGSGTHSSTLAWKIPWTEEPGGLQSMELLRVGHDWATSLSLFTFMRWRRKWQPTPVFLPGESQGRGSLAGCRLWGRTELDTTEATQQRQQQELFF